MVEGPFNGKIAAVGAWRNGYRPVGVSRNGVVTYGHTAHDSLTLGDAVVYYQDGERLYISKE